MKTLVVMPCYNAEDTIIEALDSMAVQTSKDFLLVCCDDKSTDGTLDVLRANQHRYGYHLLCNDTNLGTGETVNRCIRDLTSTLPDIEFISWISADNIMMPRFVELHQAKLREGCDVTYSAWASFSSATQNGYQVPARNLIRLKHSYCLGPCFMFRTELFRHAGPFHKLPGEDYYFAVNCALLRAKFGFIDDVLVNYRVHENSVSGRLLKADKIVICSDEARQRAQGL